MFSRGPIFITNRKITKVEHSKLKRKAILSRFKLRKAMRRAMEQA